MTNDTRLQLLKKWITTLPDLRNAELSVASADASFRRYFRATTKNSSFIIMDAPPHKEDTKPFITTTNLLEASSVRVPHIHKLNSEQGFLLLDDFGDQQYLDLLNNTSADLLYGKAMDSLLKIQKTNHQTIPKYDAKLLNFEMSLFPDWYIAKYLGKTLTRQQHQTFKNSCKPLVENALQQPQTFVHRDYHSRNLMEVDSGDTGVIDYQDAVYGPFTYDLVSLLRDCYIDWPEEQVMKWALSFKSKQIHTMNISNDNTSTDEISDEQFIRWFDLMGIQRHLKAVGIFSRLNYRDGKSGYLNDIPRTLNYIKQVSKKYSDTKPLAEFINSL